MTVGEMIEGLKGFDLDAKCVMTYYCDNDYRKIDTVRFDPIGKRVIIESHETPDFDDLQVIAREVLEEHGDNMTLTEFKIMNEFIGG
jgi:hypothetical protein